MLLNVQTALMAWRDNFLSDLIIPLVDASLQLMELDRSGELVDLQLVKSVVDCLGKTYPLSGIRYLRRGDGDVFVSVCVCVYVCVSPLCVCVCVQNRLSKKL